MKENNSCKILITGDFYLQKDSKILSYNEDDVFNDFLPVIKNCDIAAVNFEAPVEPKDKKFKLIKKTGPNLGASNESIQFLKKSGFNLLTLASNHIMDLGSEGLHTTLSECMSNNLRFVGAGPTNKHARQPAFFNIKLYKISIINIAENEFSTTNNEMPGANPLDLINNFYDIKKAKEISDFVIVAVHGGHENYLLPSPRMKSTYRFFIDAGADAVVCHHSHCISGYEIYNKGLIFYGLGNLIFEWYGPKDKTWFLGYSVQFSLEGKNIQFKLIPYFQHSDSLALRLLSIQENEKFERKMAELNKVIENDFKLSKHFDEFCRKKYKSYGNYIEPHSFRYLQALQNGGWLPTLWSKRKKYYLLNLIRCEAHRDVLQNMLEYEIGHS